MSNPRRTQAVPRDAAGTALTLKTNLLLRKGATFHSPTSPSSSGQECTAFRPPSLPRRSQTNLDDVIDAHRRRVRMTLETIDKTLAAAAESHSPSPHAASPATPLDKTFPFPDRLQKHSVAMLDQPGQERRVLRPRSTVRRPSRYHDSDSGLGTSIVTSKDKADVEAAPKKTKTTSVKASSITRSPAASTTTLPGLSDRATNKICEHILKPILAKPDLKAFHPLVIDCPRRIKEKEILCLRDLEKTLLLIAPEVTKSRGLYLDFCLSTIRCFQASVEYLSERELTRPRDLPYTSGYFIDLVDQIHQYAKQLADCKDKQTIGDMDVDAADDIKLHGGIHINGRPAELVRVKKNGKAISLATGEEVDMDEDAKGEIKFKRSQSEELADEEEIMRSMARRKKNASPDEYAPKKCREPGCNKLFKRPCDLTKHEKTHSRPWKCPIETCKYHEYGWPTEKEMDRHCNDKHSTTPPMFKCLFPPCPYKSKRESNCKQHMEKAHGWEYVRTKTNGGGKKTASKAGSVANHTPHIQGLPTPISNPPSTGIATPPREHYHNNINFPTYIPEAVPFDFNTLPQQLEIDNLDHMQYSPEYSPVDNPTPITDPGLDTSNVSVGEYAWDDIYSANRVQLPAPTFPRELAEQFVFSEAELSKTHLAPHISPIGQGNAMLFTPPSMADMDDSFDDFNVDVGANADFLLFPPTEVKPMFQQPLFGSDMPSLAAGYSQPNSQEIWGVDWSHVPNNYGYSQM